MLEGIPTMHNLTSLSQCRTGSVVLCETIWPLHGDPCGPTTATVDRGLLLERPQTTCWPKSQHRCSVGICLMLPRIFGTCVNKYADLPLFRGQTAAHPHAYSPGCHHSTTSMSLRYNSKSFKNSAVGRGTCCDHCLSAIAQIIANHAGTCIFAAHSA
jgi:hypothetical protein